MLRLSKLAALTALLLFSALPHLPAAEPQESSTEAQAEQGDLNAMRRLYMQHALAGRHEQARDWASRYNDRLSRLADEGDSKAMLLLASRFLTGQDYTPASIPDAVTWFTRAAEAGEASAAYMLGEIFARQQNAPSADRYYKLAYELYSRQPAPQSADTLYWLGFMLQNGIGTPRDPASGIAKLEQAADLGSAAAAGQLLKTYLNGIGVPRDMPKVYAYARRLADEHGDGAAAYVLAAALLLGRDMEQDIPLGERYLEQAVRANIPGAIYMKATRLEESGKLAEAAPLLRQADSMHQQDAMVRYGLLLISGAPGIIEQNIPLGLSRLELAADSFGSPRAAWELARYYAESGDSAQANAWYIVASNRGVTEAMARRGLLHLLPGSGVSWSPTEAYRWWSFGKKHGDPTCTLCVRLFLYAFTPLLLLLVFGLPAYLGHRARKLKKL